jgi:Zn-finger nucleic acid-binding protein
VSDTQGVKIDYCPKCKAVWLYKNQFDQIIEHAKTNHSSNLSENNTDEKGDQNNDHYKNYRPYSNNPKHKRGLVSDLYDY